MKILLVDDEEELVSTLAERLEIRDIESDWVLSGEEGLRLALERDYDWIVLDMKMPGLGGLETLKAIRHKRPNAKIIVITGHSSEKDRQAGLASGASHYLLKPVDVDDLVACLQGQ